MAKTPQLSTGAAGATPLGIKPEATCNGFTRGDFIDYLEGTLIPDLKASGSEFTAQDFETAVYFMRKGK